MDRQNREFFTALNREKKIDINNINLTDILEAYSKLAEKYNAFIKAQEHSIKQVDSKKQKLIFDRLFRYWIDPFNISLRNEIGATGVPKADIEIILTGKGDRAELSIETIKKIRDKYKLDREIKKFSNVTKEELLQIIKSIIYPEKEQDKQKNNQPKQPPKEQIPISISETSTKYNVGSKTELIEFIKNYIDEAENAPDTQVADQLVRIEKYTFTTGIGNLVNSYINEYELILEYDGKRCVKKIYGDINLKRFYTDKVYKRIVLEAIENLGLQNYQNRQSNKYIGSIEGIIKDGKIQWQQIFRESDLEAIQKIEIIDERARKERMARDQKGANR